MKLSFDDLIIFINVIKEGSIVKAAKKLSIPSPTISRRLIQLEQAIGGFLMYRNSRKITLTTLGQMYIDKFTNLVDEFIETAENLNDYHQKLCGTIKVTAPISLTHQWFGECIFSFKKEYPDIKIDLMATNKFVDLADMNIDIAIRVGDLADSDWIAKRLLVSKNILCTSKEYLQQLGGCTSPVDLLNKNLININNNLSWSLQFVKNSLAKGELVQILPDWIGNARSIYLIFKDRNYLPNRVQVFKQYIENYVNKNI